MARLVIDVETAALGAPTKVSPLRLPRPGRSTSRSCRGKLIRRPSNASSVSTVASSSAHEWPRSPDTCSSTASTSRSSSWVPSERPSPRQELPRLTQPRSGTGLTSKELDAEFLRLLGPRTPRPSSTTEESDPCTAAEQALARAPDVLPPLRTEAALDKEECPYARRIVSGSREQVRPGSVDRGCGSTGSGRPSPPTEDQLQKLSIQLARMRTVLVHAREELAY
mmetsp:Transcript_49210/g.110787  ORF Transcript_49210/g.110787 Transcript_49210/m.110787 type:complete len:224 (+) Transcript_49210:50-721(+)